MNVIRKILHLFHKRNTASDSHVNNEDIQNDESISVHTGMDDVSYVKFRQLVRTILNSGTVEYHHVQAMINFLNTSGGYNDSRTRHLAVILDLLPANGTLGNDDAAEIKILLETLTDDDRPKEVPHKNISASQSEKQRRKALKNRYKHKTAPPSVDHISGNDFSNDNEPWSDERRRDYYEDIDDELIIGHRYKIGYTDFYGNYSERTIILESIIYNSRGDKILVAFCEMRQETRNFKLRNTEMLIDLDDDNILK